MGAELQSIMAAVGVVLTPLITWWVGRQDRNDKRTAIMRDLEILRALNPESVEHKRLEGQVRSSLSEFLEDRQRKEETAPLFRRYYAFLTFAGIFLALTWVASQEWARESWAPWLTAGRVAAATIAISFVANILWILVRLVGAVAYAAVLWVVRFFAKRRLVRAKTGLRDAVDERDRAVEEQKAAEQVLADALRQRSQASGD